ncbi:hydroxyethylthiazole kinase [Pallidibacillus pasinlerensis]|uniref:Hydroxyethylthiazole kinase n=1 Tax=Pallidibacillus pasinlerensis TaxID=2703818 RepID=A0ABX0A8R6_9BACI|nr:hydroxyethylthiazole kinase [Pallidibacillus pasinlerensis]NCU17860.1 hydroxyethylthiazole kinase [Pallidibacillus pasinlerensis]
MNKTEAKLLFEKVKAEQPLVHFLTNTVTINDCANVTLAIGASPVMANEINGIEEMTNLAQALVINMGTITEQVYESMIRAGKAANKKGIPVILDPVGAGATTYRTELALDFLKRVKVSIIKGNASELYTLIGGDAVTKGVDAGVIPISNKELAQEAAIRFGNVVVVSGAIDAISDGEKVVQVENGDEWLPRLTGTGCMAAGVIGCFAGVTDDYFTAASVGISVIGLAGELAKKAILSHEGIGTFRVKFMDAIFRMDGDIWAEGVRLS